MTILNDEQLSQTIEHLGRLSQAVVSLRRELGETNPRNFVLLAEGPLLQIRLAKEEIQEYTGELLLEEAESDLRMRIIGPTVKWREAPIGVLAAFFDSLRKGVRSLAIYNESLRQFVWPQREVKRACELELVDLKPGSLDVGLKIPFVVPEEQPDLFFQTESSPAAPALADFLSVAEWVASASPIEELTVTFPEAKKRRIALRAIKPFVPRKTGAVDKVELYGKSLRHGNRIELTRQAGERVAAAFAETLLEREERYKGQLREIDLDKRTFLLRNLRESDLREIKCQFAGDQETIAKTLLDQWVTVIGIRHADVGEVGVGPLTVSELLPVESP